LPGRGGGRGREGVSGGGRDRKYLENPPYRIQVLSRKIGNSTTFGKFETKLLDLLNI
jgi:hypothetical protein